LWCTAAVVLSVGKFYNFIHKCRKLQICFI
jgi:hypothetical protein